MFEKYAYVQEEDVELFLKSLPWLKSKGGYNKLPEPNRLMEVNEFMSKFMSHAFSYEQFIQVTGTPGYMNTRIYWCHEYAIAMMFPTQWHINRKLQYNTTEWEKPIRYVYIGCDHDYNSKNIGHCLHIWTCKKCGFSQEVDSSD